MSLVIANGNYLKDSFSVLLLVFLMISFLRHKWSDERRVGIEELELIYSKGK